MIEKIRAGMESARVGGESMPPIETVSIDSTMKSLGVYPYLGGLCGYIVVGCIGKFSVNHIILNKGMPKH